MRAITVIFTTCFIVGTLAGADEEKREFFRRAKLECRYENGIDEDTIEKVRNGEQEYFDQKLKCYSACLFKKVGVMNYNGTINENIARARISAHVDSEKTEEILNQCRFPAEYDHCEAAGKLMQCLVQTKVIPIFE